MEQYFIYGGMALCLFSLWAIARHDVLRLTRPQRRVTGEVVDHRESRDNDGISYAAIYRFVDGSGEHRVTDPVLSASRQPPLGTMRELAYPAGRPDLARPPRPLLWGAVYLFLIALVAMFVAKAMGLLPD